jgi:LacI family transcriptional regulator
MARQLRAGYRGVVKRRVTLKDIARHAGVATGTVSMTINNNPLVAEATREHVLRVIKEHGYVYDRAAAQLRKKRTNIVGMSICDLLNPYFAEIAASVDQVLEEHRRVLFVGNSAESVKRQARFLGTLREYNVEGVILMPAIGTPRAAVERVREWHIPIVMVSRYVPQVDADYVGSDNRLGSVLATRHLLDLGHRRIAFVGLNRRTTTARDRFAGFRAALAEVRVAPRNDLVVECKSTRPDGYYAIHRLFGTDEPPTAVVCFNDLIAFGVMLGLRQLGLEPGRDCSVVGADDVTEASLWLPPLTTVAVDTAGIGRAAAHVLHERIEHPDGPAQRLVIPPKLTVRGSCGPAPSPAVSSNRRQ